jgi:hypothetical protein
LEEHRNWRPFGWSFLAQYYAHGKDFRQAYEIVREFAPKPAVATPQVRGGRAGMERDFYHHSNDIVLGLALYGTQLHDGKLDDALETLRTVRKQKNAPRYLSFVEAELCARRKDWEGAWDAWTEFPTKGG